MASAISTHTKGPITPNGLKHTVDLCGNIKSAKYTAMIPKHKVGVMALHFVSFDFERRSQVLIQVLIMLIRNSDDFTQKELVTAMLVDFLSYVKKEGPS